MKMAHKSVIRNLIVAVPCLVAGLVLLTSTASSQTARPTFDPSLYRHVVQVGWVVKDLDSVVDYWQMLGLRNIRRDGVRDFPDVTYRGKKTPLKMKMAFGDIGGVQIEWIQPVEGHSVYDEFLSAHGDGVHHLAYQMPSPAVMEQQIQYFQSLGVGVVQSGTWKGQKGEGRFAYLDTAPEGGGITLELIYNPDWPSGGENARANEYPFNKINHFGFVVPEVHKVSAFWQRIGFGKLQIIHNVSLDRMYRGKPGKFEMDLGWNRRGDLPFEWVQSTLGPNDYIEYQKDHGEGLHHLGFSVKDMDAAIAHFKAKGVTASMSGGWDINGRKGRFAYLDTDPHGGVTVELIWNQPRSK
jgi:catechol 2,3-dioxygenase-like lactoylglutathione lyase family enzyme